jgi:Protein of unknown function (DUF2946)
MRWFRSNVRSGAWFALVAMALQLALTFGHLHLRVASAASAQLAAKASDTLPDGSSLPTKPRLVDEHCAVCTLIQMAGSGAPAAAASLPLPTLFTSAPFIIRVEHELAASPPLNFQARGPPIA